MPHEVHHHALVRADRIRRPGAAPVQLGAAFLYPQKDLSQGVDEAATEHSRRDGRDVVVIVPELEPVVLFLAGGNRRKGRWSRTAPDPARRVQAAISSPVKTHETPKSAMRVEIPATSATHPANLEVAEQLPGIREGDNQSAGLTDLSGSSFCAPAK